MMTLEEKRYAITVKLTVEVSERESVRFTGDLTENRLH